MRGELPIRRVVEGRHLKHSLEACLMDTGAMFDIVVGLINKGRAFEVEDEKKDLQPMEAIKRYDVHTPVSIDLCENTKYCRSQRPRARTSFD